MSLYEHDVTAIECDCLACQSLRALYRKINEDWRNAMDEECARILYGSRK